jgi:hypothetical protein
VGCKRHIFAQYQYQNDMKDMFENLCAHGSD